MAVVDSAKQDVPEEAAVRGVRFPGFDLATCIEVPRTLHMKGGGQATPDQLAAHLGYKGTNNGSYLTKVGAAVAFGVIHKVGPVYMLTPRAHRILSPTYPADQKVALVEAFMSVPLFKRIYEDFRGKELPPKFGMSNALRLTYGVAPARVKDAYRILMESADTAGFFETKAGVRTHLIMPLTQPIPGAASTAATGEQSQPRQEFGGGSGGGGGGGEEGGQTDRQRPPAGTMSEVKTKYLSTLIKLFEDKAEKGDVDEKLMERIERLMGD